MSPERRGRRVTPAALVLLVLVAVIAPGASAGAAPTVQSMVVGSRGQIVSSARSVTASATTLRVSNRHCAVGAGTPLAVLTDLRGPGISVRDYGHCNSSPNNSGSLFVFNVAGEENHGQSGWEYKVNNVSGSTGAADVSGAQGNGRLLASGARVLWFYCHAGVGGCQRTLAVSAASTVSHGSRLSVMVTGYDNEGRGIPIAGAIVSLGSDFASTASNGRATLLVPSGRGRYSLTATRRGLVPAFPETIAAR
jgi:hypothetical protein